MNYYRFILVDYLSVDSNSDVNYVIKNTFVHVLCNNISLLSHMSQYELKKVEAQKEVSTGTKLHHIKWMYLTKKVCYKAAKYEYQNNHVMLYNMRGIPAAHIEYVVNKMKIKAQHNPYYRNQIDTICKERKEREKQPGYYHFDNYQTMLKHYHADDYDTMLKHKYLVRFLYHV